MNFLYGDKSAQFPTPLARTPRSVHSGGSPRGNGGPNVHFDELVMGDDDEAYGRPLGAHSTFDSTVYDTLTAAVDAERDLSIDQSGQLAAVAGRAGVLLVDLENPQTTPDRLLADDSKRVAFNPHTIHRNLLLAASGRNTSLLDVETSLEPLQFQLRTHDQSVEDLSWNFFDPSMFATCSRDACVNVWDIRAPKKKVVQFCAWTAPCTRLAWSRFDRIRLASAHGSEIRLWDMRKTGYTALIPAFSDDITALEWSPSADCEILAASNSYGAKLFNTNDQQEKLSIKATDSSAGSFTAAFIPFGKGIVSADAGLIALYKLTESNVASPIEYFQLPSSAHIARLDWRIVAKSFADNAYQLCALSEKGDLCMYKIDPILLEDLGYSAAAKYGSSHSSWDSTDLSGVRFDEVWRSQSPTPESSFPGRTNALNHSPEPKVKEEIEGLAREVSGIEVLAWDASQRSCELEVKSHEIARDASQLEIADENKALCFRVAIRFPLGYPVAAIPLFEVRSSECLSEKECRAIENNLETLAHASVERQRPCLLNCFASLQANVALFKESSMYSRSPATVLTSDSAVQPSVHGHKVFDGTKIPAPSVVGVSFSPSGSLVRFGNVVSSKVTTAADLSASGLFSSDLNTNVQIVDYSRAIWACVNIEMATELRSPEPGRLVSKCQQALLYCEGNHALQVTWNAACVAARSAESARKGVPWESQSCGGKLIQKLMAMHAELRDVQTVSYLLSIFLPCVNSAVIQSEWSVKFGSCVRLYCDYLARLSYFEQSAEILKSCAALPIVNSVGLRFGSSSSGTFCCVCNITIKGLAVVCPQCGHGGHPEHIEGWFNSTDIEGEYDPLCPAGCGCRCVVR